MSENDYQSLVARFELRQALAMMRSDWGDTLEDVSVAEIWPSIARLILALNDTGATTTADRLVDDLVRNIAAAKAITAADDALNGADDG